MSVTPEPPAETASQFTGSSDGVERLWTPHRMVYVGSHHGDPNAQNECPFCQAPKRSDSEGLIVHRGETCYVVMNLFPYNPGHLLVCPYRHVASYPDLTRAEREELGELTAQAMRVTEAVQGAQGFNLGMNQGSVAGAGIAGHLHQHVVPRWSGDANFFPIIAQTKAVPELIGNTRDALANAWQQVEDDAR